jgi:hypothetical protein
MIKAFYDNLHLVNLFPLIDADFDVEIGDDNWIKAIGKYKTYGRRQQVCIPSFSSINALFDPNQFLSVNKDNIPELKTASNFLSAEPE